MSKLATNRRILIMAMAAILLPFAMISASPTERNTTETQDIKITDTTTEYPTVSINNDTLLPTSIECYCNLPECLSTSGSYNPCTTRLGCFFELQPADILKSNKTRNPLSEDQFSTVFIEDYKVNGVFGCLESSPVNKTCNQILKSMENDESEFPDLHSQNATNQSTKIKTYYCCEQAMCNEHISLPLNGEYVQVMVLTNALRLMDINIKMNENQNTTNVPDVKTETAENNSTLFLSKPSVHYGVISENITTHIPLKHLVDEEQDKNSTMAENEKSPVVSTTEKTSQDTRFITVIVVKSDFNNNSTNDKDLSVPSTTESKLESNFTHVNEHDFNTGIQQLISHKDNSSIVSDLKNNLNITLKSNLSIIDNTSINTNEIKANYSYDSKLDLNITAEPYVNQTLSLNSSTQAASSESSTTLPKSMTTPLYKHKLVSNVITPESNLNVSNALSLNTSSQAVLTESFETQSMSSTDLFNTEVLNNTIKNTEERKSNSKKVLHVIKKRHDAHYKMQNFQETTKPDFNDDLSNNKDLIIPSTTVPSIQSDSINLSTLSFKNAVLELLFRRLCNHSFLSVLEHTDSFANTSFETNLNALDTLCLRISSQSDLSVSSNNQPIDSTDLGDKEQDTFISKNLQHVIKKRHDTHYGMHNIQEQTKQDFNGTLTYNKSLSVLNNTVTTSKSNITHIKNSDLHYAIVELLFQVMYNDSQVSALQSNVSTTPESYVNQTDILSVNTTIQPILSESSTIQSETMNNSSYGPNVNSTTESNLNISNTLNLNTSSQVASSESSTKQPETMSIPTSMYESNISTTLESNLNLTNTLSLNTSSEAASSESSTTQSETMTTPLYEHKLVSNVSSIPESNLNVSNALSLNTSSQAVVTESSGTHPIDYPDLKQTEVVNNTMKIKEKDQSNSKNVQHNIKKRHDAHYGMHNNEEQTNKDFNGNLTYNKSLSDLNNTVATSKSNITHLNKSDIHYVLLELLFQEMYNDSQISSLSPNASTTPESYVNQTDILSINTTTQPTSSESYTTQPETINNSSYDSTLGINVSTILESNLNSTNTTSQPTSSEFFTPQPETMNNFSYESNVSSTTESNLNISNTLNLNASYQVTSSESSTTQPETMTTPLYEHKLVSNVSSIPKSNLNVSNALSLNTSSQAVVTESSGTQSMNSTDLIRDTEDLTTTIEITEEDQSNSKNVQHNIKKRHDAHNEMHNIQEQTKLDINGNSTYNQRLSVPNNTVTSSKSNITHLKELYLHNLLVEILFEEIYNNTRVLTLDSNTSTTPEFYDNQTDILSVNTTIQPTLSESSTIQSETMNNSSYGPNVNSTTESNLNISNTLNLNTSSQVASSESSTKQPETMSIPTSMYESNISTTLESNLNLTNTLSLNTSSEAASSESSTTQSETMTTPLYEHKLVSNVSSIPESNLNVSNALSLNTSSQAVVTESSGTQSMNSTDLIRDTEDLTTTIKITEEDQSNSKNVQHNIKKRHDAPYGMHNNQDQIKPDLNDKSTYDKKLNIPFTTVATSEFKSTHPKKINFRNIIAGRLFRQVYRPEYKNINPINTLSANTLSQIVPSESSETQKMDYTDPEDTDITSTFLKTTEEDDMNSEYLLHIIKKRHDEFNDATPAQPIGEPTANGTLPPETAAMPALPTEGNDNKMGDTVDSAVHQNGGVTDLSHYRPNVDGMLWIRHTAWTTGTVGLLAVVGIICMTVVTLLVLAAVRIVRRADVFRNFKDVCSNPGHPCPCQGSRFPASAFRHTTRPAGRGIRVNHNSSSAPVHSPDSVGNTAFVYATVPVEPSNAKPVQIRR